MSRKRELRLIVALGLGDAALCDGEVLWVNLDADEVAARLDAGNASGAGTHEGVEDKFTIACCTLYNPSHQTGWLRAWMVNVL